MGDFCTICYNARLDNTASVFLQAINKHMTKSAVYANSIFRGLTFLENSCNYDPPEKLVEYSWNVVLDIFLEFYNGP